MQRKSRYFFSNGKTFGLFFAWQGESFYYETKKDGDKCRHPMYNLIYIILEVRIDAAPLLDCRNNVECNELVAHLAKVSVACIELCNLLGSTDRHLV